MSHEALILLYRRCTPRSPYPLVQIADYPETGMVSPIRSITTSDVASATSCRSAGAATIDCLISRAAPAGSVPFEYTLVIRRALARAMPDRGDNFVRIGGPVESIMSFPLANDFRGDLFQFSQHFSFGGRHNKNDDPIRSSIFIMLNYV